MSLTPLWFLCQLLTIFFKIKMSSKQIKVLLVMDKKSIIKVVLTVIKYGITLVLGYLGGASDVI